MAQLAHTDAGTARPNSVGGRARPRSCGGARRSTGGRGPETGAARLPTRREGQRRQAFEFGLAAERSVAGFLRAGGYDVLGRRVRAGQGEVDLVVTRDDTVAFVEVKARRKGYEGLEAVTPRKQARIGAAASAWLSRNPQYAGHTIRFDVALVWPGSRLDYLENAFELAGSEDCIW